MTSMMRTGSGGRVQEVEGGKVVSSEKEEVPHTSQVELDLTQMHSGRAPLSSIDNVERSKQTEKVEERGKKS